MSNHTAEGRRRHRDFRRERMARDLVRHPVYAGLPVSQRVTLSELKLIGRDLYRYIKQRGVILPDGSVNPAVEAHRKNAHEQLVSLQVFMELNRTQSSADAVVDIVSLMQTGTGEPLDAAAAEPADADTEDTKR